MPRIPVVDQDACIGCEVCTQICPEVFKMEGEEGHGHDHGHKSVVYNPTGAPEAKIEEAMDNCPVACIHWQE
ncbi:ferredoxin [Desulfuromonas versatilis]|uniref:Ferredoxin n=1 Tax=Desulfuromonas versatilis TaxID=2802975 RepID=A0ABM8HVQ6_9BACT|nr:ferredoxin [Desulfuromonas versatilis]BCR04633.1 ferredoxin [Desulfuromonas versatilis]